MPIPDPDRPVSRGTYTSPAPPSPRPSVASRASKSSLRREQERQGTPPIHPRPTSAAYSRPHTPHTTAVAPAEEPARAPSPPPPPPPKPTQQPFSPVFALLNSTSHASNRQTIHHPTVHYIFADDDPERLTAALAHHHGAASYDGNGSEVPDRGVLLDLEPTADGAGYEVAWASSLTADWAATSARVSRMEEGAAGGATVPGLGGNLVLKIEGVSLEPAAVGGGGGGGASGPLGKGSTSTPEAEMHSSGGSMGRGRSAPASEGYADLLQDFEKRMATLRKVVEAGAARQRALGGAGDGQLVGAAPGDVVPASSRPQTGGNDTQG
ncbi:hypothetical protein CHGG_10843 [Chaetomium globosum CBS 148.51]|uniref:Uncharacterized protein n=1 Tax=Chaetomium globosum (strain ATCC 6205 / CBS 148.51 / DSM 1962 / NBRC 6347 / NRRL 1970) TaxID=306901 RepID=Q2GMG1_CHAGB|nr:uncharacterized protein CHGG_10843 [Chaetomium globosum CBS 148.51]EAQ83025.1 hypothetical protein CHGG_10843 [Chaetomium globosum CBS 148.51]